MVGKRTQVWIDGFQSKLFIRVLAYWLIYQISLWNFLFVWRMLQEGPGDLADQFGRFFLDNYPMLICFIVIVPCFALDAVRFAHRLVGPLYRFRKTMQAVTAREPVRLIKLREGDYLLEMRDDLNAMLTYLQQRGVVTLVEPGTAAPNDSQSGKDLLTQVGGQR
jgi:hypothetical protein